MGIRTFARTYCPVVMSVGVVALGELFAHASPPPIEAAPPAGLTIHARDHVPSAPPSVRIKEPTVGPDPPLPLEVVTRIFRRTSAVPLRDCYVRALRSAPGLSGDILTSFVVTQEGSVRSAEITQGLHPDLDTCVLKQIKQTTFPQPKRGGEVTVRYPFHFRMN